MTPPGRVLVVLALTFAAVHSEDPVRYDGHRLLRVHPQTEQHITELRVLNNNGEVDFWMEPSRPGHPAQIIVAPEKLTRTGIQKYLSNMRMEILMHDVQSIIDQQGKQVQRLSFDGTPFDWEHYHTLDSINLWLREQAAKFNQIATLVVAGNSSEGRQLTGLRIAHKLNLPIVFVEAGIHGCEWIGPATATWFIQQALNESASDIIKSYEWHVFPSVNPDGYAYTQKDRLWKKTRSKVGVFCRGVDANRNWPFEWESVSSPCSLYYSGEKPSSEPETQGLMSYLNAVAGRTRVYISLHSFSQLLMYPWGYTSEPTSSNSRFAEIAEEAVAKLKARHGTVYEHGSISNTVTMYRNAGNALDYAYSIGIPYPFVFELRDKGGYGVLLPKEQIIPTAEETFDALTVILEEAKK